MSTTIRDIVRKNFENDKSTLLVTLYFPELHFVKSTDITKDLYQIYSSRGKVKSKLVNKCKGENYTYLL